MWFVPGAAICPQGCRNGGVCVAPGICSCPEGWLGGACHAGEFKLRPNTHNVHHCTLQAQRLLSLFFLSCSLKPLFSFAFPESLWTVDALMRRNMVQVSVCQTAENDISPMHVGKFSAQRFSRCDRHGDTTHLFLVFGFRSSSQSLACFSGFTND